MATPTFPIVTFAFHTPLVRRAHATRIGWEDSYSLFGGTLDFSDCIASDIPINTPLTNVA
jgi:hypothetical protein